MAVIVPVFVVVCVFVVVVVTVDITAAVVVCSASTTWPRGICTAHTYMKYTNSLVATFIIPA